MSYPRLGLIRLPAICLDNIRRRLSHASPFIRFNFGLASPDLPIARNFCALPASAVAQLVARRPGGSPYRRCTPVIFGPVAEHLVRQRNWYEQMGPVNAPDAELYRITDALTYNSLVFTSDGTLVRESLLNRGDENEFCGIERRGEDAFRFLAPPPSAPRIHVGKSVMLRQNWDPNYGHWLIEGLPRLALVLEAVDIADTVFFVTLTDSKMAKVFADSLQLFGISRDKLRYISDEVIHSEELFYPTPMTIQPWVKAPRVVRFLEDVARRVTSDHVGNQFPRKIYISRPETSRRRIRNHEAIRAFFLARGYSEVRPADLTFTQQVSTFSRATHVVGVLGAECVNFAFSPQGVRFLGLAPDLMQDDFFWDLASHKGGAYSCLHGPAADPSSGMNSPFSIDLDLLPAIVEAFERN